MAKVKCIVGYLAIPSSQSRIVAIPVCLQTLQFIFELQWTARLCLEQNCFSSCCLQGESAHAATSPAGDAASCATCHMDKSGIPVRCAQNVASACALLPCAVSPHALVLPFRALLTVNMLTRRVCSKGSVCLLLQKWCNFYNVIRSRIFISIESHLDMALSNYLFSI